MTDATVSVENNSRTPIALGSQLEDHPKAATSRAALVVAMAPLVVATVATVVAAAEAHHMVLAEELVVAVIAEDEAT
jgi:hypothetical protein